MRTMTFKRDPYLEQWTVLGPTELEQVNSGYTNKQMTSYWDAHVENGLQCALKSEIKFHFGEVVFKKLPQMLCNYLLENIFVICTIFLSFSDHFSGTSFISKMFFRTY